MLADYRCNYEEKVVFLHEMVYHNNNDRRIHVQAPKRKAQSSFAYIIIRSHFLICRWRRNDGTGF